MSSLSSVGSSSEVTQCEKPLNQESSSPSFPWNVLVYWKDVLLIAGIATAIVGIALAVFSGMIPCAVCFGICAVVLGFALYHIHKDVFWRVFHDTLEGMKATHQELKQTNKELEQTREGLQQQVVNLELIVTQLTQSIRQIEDAVEKFNAGKVAFDGLIQTMKEELSNSQKWCAEIRSQLQGERQDFYEKFDKLCHFLNDLVTNNSTIEKMNVLKELNQQIAAERSALHALKIEYAEQLTKLTLLKQDFEEIKENLKKEVGDFHGENEALQNLLERLSALQIPQIDEPLIQRLSLSDRA